MLHDKHACLYVCFILFFKLTVKLLSKIPDKLEKINSYLTMLTANTEFSESAALFAAILLYFFLVHVHEIQ